MLSAKWWWYCLDFNVSILMLILSITVHERSPRISLFVCGVNLFVLNVLDLMCYVYVIKTAFVRVCTNNRHTCLHVSVIFVGQDNFDMPKYIYIIIIIFFYFFFIFFYFFFFFLGGGGGGVINLKWWTKLCHSYVINNGNALIVTGQLL